MSDQTDRERGDDRLLQLAQFLREYVPPDRFDMRAYLQGRHYELEAETCRSTACAVGWCAAVFPEHWTYEWQDSYAPVLKSFAVTRPDEVKRSLVYSRCHRSALKFFDLTDMEFDYLFGERNERDPYEEAEVLTLFVQDNREIPDDWEDDYYDNENEDEGWC